MKLALLAGKYFIDGGALHCDVETYCVKAGEVIESGQVVQYCGRDWLVDNPSRLWFEDNPKSPIFTEGDCVRIFALDAISAFRSDVEIQHDCIIRHPENVSDGMTLYTVVH